MEIALEQRTAGLPETLRAEVRPTPVPEPRILHVNEEVCGLVGISRGFVESPRGVAVFSGNDLPAGARPVASLYAGHQFGVWVPQLGDGRAILLGESRGPDGRAWELQLKGAGPTPFSRGGDGRAVLRSTVREYLCSEAMHGLGIPTTRALCLVASPMPVFREEVETAAVLCRVAASHVRFGSFEVLFHRRMDAELRLLAEHVIGHHFPDLAGRPDRFPALLREVVRRTAGLVARWQAVGFAHGVMNTDNMSILGLTLDYGPFGFLDAYEPGFVCNHSDHHGRYAFDQQPAVARWNLRCLAQALLPLMTHEEAVDALGTFDEAFVTAYARELRHKLGLAGEEDDDAALASEWLAMMAGSRADHTLTFRALAAFSTSAGATNEGLRDRFLDRERFDAWAARYAARLAREASVDAERGARMRATNPKFVLRNWVAQQVIAAAERGDGSELARVFHVLQRPFDEHPAHEDLAAEPPEWGRHLEVSCSS
jgi:uncharacterized protein YdiU (UPF0061 family)